MDEGYTCEIWEDGQYIIYTPDGMPIGPALDSQQDGQAIADWLNSASNSLERYYGYLTRKNK